MAVNETSQAQIEGLATLLVLDDEIRKLSTLREFGFFSTNETHRLIPYHTAYMWQMKEFIGAHLATQSGTAELDVQAPANQWLKQKINALLASSRAKEIYQFNFEQTETDVTAIDWPDSLPHHVLWCPFLSPSNDLSGGLILFRETPFTDSEIRMLSWLIASYQYTWQILTKPKMIPTWQKLKKKPYIYSIACILLVILFFPTRLSVFGNGTVSPKAPVLINAPMQGIIKSFAVSPGDQVKAGQLLFVIDKTDLQASAEVSNRDALLTEAKLRTAINEGFENKDSRAEVPILQAQLAIDKAHLDYTRELLAKTDVTSPIAGIVIFDSKEDWVGQPIRTGERILIVANPTSIKLKITVPVSSSIKLEMGAKGNFFLYGQLSSVPIHLTALGYNAKLMPNKILAYELEADFINPKDSVQIGAQGTVELYGHRVPFIYYLLRRPLQALRQTLGI